MAIIEARGLARTFKSRKRTVEAVRGVDLTVREGEIVGFLGPNGAGKTTTLRMLTTLLKPTAGTATVAGADLLANPLDVRKKIGYVPQAIGETMGGTDPSCLVIEELLDQAALYRIGAREARQRAERLAAQLELTGLEQRLARNGLIRRVPGRNRYTLTRDGLLFAHFYTKVYDHVLRPLMAPDRPNAPPELLAALDSLDRLAASRIADARVPTAA